MGKLITVDDIEITFEEDLEKYIDILKNKLNCSINIIKHIKLLLFRIFFLVANS